MSSSDLIADVNKAARYYRVFFEWAWSILSQEPLHWNWHIGYLADQLQYLGSFIIDREPAPFDMIINIPPGMTKSSLVTQAFPVWLWLHDPSICTIITSYSDGISSDHSLRAKNIIASEDFQIFNYYIAARHGSALHLTKDTEKNWQNNYGGFYYATSTGGTVTGKHAHLIIRDDPLSAEQAESPAKRLRAHRYNDRTLPSRKKNKDGTPTVTVMQRLHQDDTTGHDLKKVGKEIFHICLPAEISEHVKPPEVEKYYKNGLLDPTRASRKILSQQHIDLGSYAFAGQYGQYPIPEGGNKVKEEWFGYTDDAPDIIWDLWVDGAYTESTKNDPTGLMVSGFDPRTRRVIIKHAKSVFMGLPELLKFIPKYVEEHGFNMAGRIFIEPKASGYSIIQMLRQLTNYDVLKIVGRLVQAGKEGRINAAAPRVEADRVHLINGNWNREFVDQICGFPGEPHDEYVDLLGYATHYYLK